MRDHRSMPLSNRQMVNEAGCAPAMDPMTQMANLSRLPSELLLLIGSFIDSEPDYFHLLSTCRRLAELFHEMLYVTNVRNSGASALLWACRTGSTATACHALAAGAEVNQSFFRDQRALASAIRKGKKLGRYVSGSCVRELQRMPLAATPLGLAAQHRHLDLVRLLLTRGADPTLFDRAPALDHILIWAPLHWALSCGRFYAKGDSSHPTKATPVPVSVDIVDALLRAGADPNAPKLDEPSRSAWSYLRTYNNEVDPGLPLAMAASCDHAPVEALRLLLDAGARPCDERLRATGCNGGLATGGVRSLVFYWLTADHPTTRADDDHLIKDEKLLLLMKRMEPSSLRREGLTLTEDNVAAMLPYVTDTRVEIAEMIWASPGTLAVSGLYALFDIWLRERKLLSDITVADRARAQLTLRKLEKLIIRLYDTGAFRYIDPDTDGPARPEDLSLAFQEYCQTSVLDDVTAFESLLVSRGFLRFRETERRQLSIPEVIEIKMKMFERGETWATRR